MKWVKVEDRLPPEETDVLIIDQQQELHIGFYVCKIWYKGSFISDGDETCPWNCTHWMHLPKAPKDHESWMIVEDKQRLIEIFDAMLKKLDELPIHAKNSFVTNRDLYAFLSLISSILKE